MIWMLKQPHVSQTTSKYPSKMCTVLVILEKQCQNNLLGSFYDLECRERKMTVTMAIKINFLLNHSHATK